MSYQKQKNLAFTIVELLIVIVIIGILAAITIVSYRGITQRATEATLQADLSNASKKIKLYFADHGVYPTTMDPDGNGKYCPTGPTDVNYCIKPSGGSVFEYTATDPKLDFVLKSTKGTIAYQINKDTGPVVSSVTPASFVKAWGGSMSDIAQALTQTSDGGYAITGSTMSFGAGNDNVFLTKFDSSGNFVWNKTWGGAGSDQAYGVIQSSDGNLFLTGYTGSYGSGSDDVFIIKYDSNGNLVWNKTWGGSSTECGYDIIQTNDSGYAITGTSQSYGVGNGDVFLAKYDSSGNLAWSKTWGGSSSDLGMSLIQSADNSYIVTGYTQSYGAGVWDSFLIKYDSAGNIIWNKTWGGGSSEITKGLTLSTDGNYVVAGATQSFGSGNDDAFVVKYDPSGNVIWSKTWGGSGNDQGHSIVSTIDNNYIIAGYTAGYGAGSNDVLLLKFDINGSFIWSKTWGGTNNESVVGGNDLVLKSDGSLGLVGYTSGYGAGGNDAFLIKFKSDGTMNNCSSPMCQSPSATVMTPSATVTIPSASVTSPSATVTNPSATITSPSATTTTVVAP